MNNVIGLSSIFSHFVKYYLPVDSVHYFQSQEIGLAYVVLFIVDYLGECDIKCDIFCELF